MSEVLQKCKEIYERLETFLSEKGIYIEIPKQSFKNIIVIKLIQGDIIVGNITLFIVPGDEMEPDDHISIGWVGVNEEYRGQNIGYMLLFLGITYTYPQCNYNMITLDDDTDKRENYRNDEHYKANHMYGKIGFVNPNGDYTDNERVSFVNKNIDTYQAISKRITDVKDTGLKNKAMLATKEFIQQQNKLLISKSRESIKKFRRSKRLKRETPFFNYDVLGKEGKYISSSPFNLPLNRKRKISTHSRTIGSRSARSARSPSRSANRSARSLGRKATSSRTIRSLGGNKRKTKKVK